MPYLQWRYKPATLNGKPVNRRRKSSWTPSSRGSSRDRTELLNQRWEHALDFRVANQLVRTEPSRRMKSSRCAENMEGQ
jgi:hypothetical protein